MVTEYTAERLIEEVQGDFTGQFMPPTEYLLSEYNALLRMLTLALPDSDAQCTALPENGRLALTVDACAVRRIFCGEDELLRCSAALLALLPDAKLYCVTDGGIDVSVDGACTVYYRALPSDALTAVFPLDARYIPLMRAWLAHRACLYVGDLASADAYGTEYNLLLADFKAENGVAE